MKRIIHQLTLPPQPSISDVYRLISLIVLSCALITAAIIFTAPQPWKIPLITLTSILALSAFSYLTYCLFKKLSKHYQAQELYTQLLASHDDLFLVLDDQENVVVKPDNKLTASNDNIKTMKDLIDLNIVTQNDYAVFSQAISGQKHGAIKCYLPSKQYDATLQIQPLYTKASSYNTHRLSSAPLEEKPSYFVITASSETLSSSAIAPLDQHIGFITVAKDGNTIAYANHYCTELIGYKNEQEVIGQKLTNFFSKKLIKKLHSEGGSNIPSTTYITSEDGKKNLVTYCIIETSTAPGGKAICFFQIPLRVETETNVEKAENVILDSPLATMLLDSAGNIISSNKAFNKLCDKQKPNSLFELSSQDNLPIRNYFDYLSSTHKPKLKPLEIKGAFNKDMTVSAYVSPIYNNRKQHQGYLCHLIDSTEFKNLELRFVHSQKMQAIGQLAGGIAHDFNNLLTAMMGFCDLLLMRHPAGDPSFANIMQVKQNANRAANLIRQLLAFSRKQTLQPKVINITDTLADLSNLIGRLIGENIHLDIIYGKDLGYIKVDQGQLEQVIINLAVNARDAMQKGGTLTIETKNVHITSHQPLGKNLIAPTEEDLHMEDGDYLLIEISDTGEGIEAALLDKIFEPFFSTKEIGSGTGLGLSTVYGIIKQTNGYIFVDSTPGKGTTFHIYLKQYQKVEETETIEQESSQSQDLTGKETILLVEDEAPVRMFSKSALVNKGYTVIEAESGESAIEEIEKHKGKIDMIISDVIMPGMSGPDMIKHISKNYPDIKVIYTSGYTEDAFAKAFGEEHEFNFLPKPYTLKQLASKVKNLLNA